MGPTTLQLVYNCYHATPEPLPHSKVCLLSLHYNHQGFVLQTKAGRRHNGNHSNLTDRTAKAK